MALLAQLFVVNARGNHIDWTMHPLVGAADPALCTPDPEEDIAFGAVSETQAHHVWLLGTADDYLLGLEADGNCILRPRRGAEAGEIVVPLASHGWRCPIHFAHNHLDAMDLLLNGRHDGQFHPIDQNWLKAGGTLTQPLDAAADDVAADTAEEDDDVHHLHLSGCLAEYRQHVDSERGIVTFERIAGLVGRQMEVVKLGLNGHGVVHFADACLALDASLQSSEEAMSKAVSANDTLDYQVAANGCWRRSFQPTPVPGERSGFLASRTIPGLRSTRPLRLGSYPLMVPPTRRELTARPF